PWPPKPRDTARSNQCQQTPQGACGAVREPVLFRSVLHDCETAVALTMPLIPTPFHTAWARSCRSILHVRHPLSAAVLPCADITPMSRLTHNGPISLPCCSTPPSR